MERSIIDRSQIPSEKQKPFQDKLIMEELIAMPMDKAMAFKCDCWAELCGIRQRMYLLSVILRKTNGFRLAQKTIEEPLTESQRVEYDRAEWKGYAKQTYNLYISKVILEVES